MRFSHSNIFLFLSILPFMVTNILPYKSGFLLTKCFQKQAKFCVVRTGPEAKRYLDRCLLMSSSSSWKSIVSDGDIISDTKGENAAQVRCTDASTLKAPYSSTWFSSPFFENLECPHGRQFSRRCDL